ncbi:MAG TPA: hypothetical protein VNL92_07455 [Dehalococcoidia bacterium]|nr:hypothetical protein [Dehalococcoidia bacterium]
MILFKHPGRRLAILAVVVALVAGAAVGVWQLFGDDEGPTPVPGSVEPPSLRDAPLREGWPDSLELGTASGLGFADEFDDVEGLRFRYQYLAGGVQNSWRAWEDGEFVHRYVEESAQRDLIPVFTYYMLFQSSPGGSEGDANFASLNDRETMRRYFQDVIALFEQASAHNDLPIVVHMEPDLWGQMHTRSRDDDASTVPAVVGSTGLPELEGLPDTFAGFGQAVVRLRDMYAPDVLLAYHLSVWGVGSDIVYEDPPDDTVAEYARRSADFYHSIDADFDLVFSEFSDRDAGFKEHVYGDGGASWWDESDFHRNLVFLSTFVEQTKRRIVMWQIPYGNTQMRTLDNTWNHYQDNRVEWLLGEERDEHLRAYAEAGVIALLFGRGADGATDASDAAGDGVTNPEPINGNTSRSALADDDGGLFRSLAKAYYESGPLALPS